MALFQRRIGIHSDLHLETPERGPGFKLPLQNVDVLVVAGDVAPPCWQLMRKHRHGALAWLRKTVGPTTPIVFVMGNNEYGHYPYEEVLDALAAEAREHDIHFLHNERVEIDGLEFLGTPLFTSQRLPGLDTDVLRAEISQKLVTFNHKRLEHDHCICGARPVCVAGHWKTGTKGPQGEILDSDWFAHEHEKAGQFLDGALARPITGPRIVVSHWAPSLRSIPTSEGDLQPKHTYWASDQEAHVQRAHAWIHGHVHAAPHYRVGSDGTKGLVVSNCLGTSVGPFRNEGYHPQGVLSVEWKRGTNGGVDWVRTNWAT